MTLVKLVLEGMHVYWFSLSKVAKYILRRIRQTF